MDERRTYRRYSIWFPVTIDVIGREVWAICRDAGVGGLLLSAVAPLDVGTDATLRFRLKPHSGAFIEHVAPSRVVRRQENDDDLVLAFPYRLALEFLTPLPKLLDEIQSCEVEVA